MNHLKNNTQAVRRKIKTTKRIFGPSGNKTTKKNSIINNNIQYAFTDEFFLLKDISGNNNENLATLLGTTTRTIQNKKNNNEPFDLAQTERLRKLSWLYKEGNEIFGKKEEFNKWLQTPSYGLDYNIPAVLLKQPGG